MTFSQTTGQGLASQRCNMTCAKDSCLGWCAPSNCAVPPLVRLGATPVNTVLQDLTVIKDTSRTFTVDNV
ncbi:hypothetical protein E2C01_079510 [Portunus trituberculatus]|uniref:Uncharacterized protein n=1 Tax=Portunus trituberculatus TaxID=210409 RepID=A0A5B7IH35_PORTR|nr:hypothetical protein [Portunus trituberculatus]